MATQREKAERFRALHQREGAFLIPNPWDAGSARLLQGLGFEALATTSAGFAQALGRLDGSVTLEEKLEHCRSLAAASDLPISADLENGFADQPDKAAQTIVRAAEAGMVGGSIEDYSGSGVYEFDLAVERIRAAVKAARTLDFPFVLTARAENHLHGHDDLHDTIRRLQAYAEAGADVLYAPGLARLEDVRQVAQSVDKPLNVLAPCIASATVAELAAAGAKRISTGSALANAAIGALLRAGEELRDRGSFVWLTSIAASADVDRYLQP